MVVEGKSQVYLYTHWTGYKLAETVREALKRGIERWQDGQYLARIIFCEMVKGGEMDLTGFGISSVIGDNGHPIIVVNVDDQTIGFAEEGKEPQCDAKWALPEYVRLSAEAISQAYNRND
jgi:hypothetical protein